MSTCTCCLLWLVLLRLSDLWWLHFLLQQVCLQNFEFRCSRVKSVYSQEQKSLTLLRGCRLYGGSTIAAPEDHDVAPAIRRQETEYAELVCRCLPGCHGHQLWKRLVGGDDEQWTVTGVTTRRAWRTCWPEPELVVTSVQTCVCHFTNTDDITCVRPHVTPGRSRCPPGPGDVGWRQCSRRRRRSSTSTMSAGDHHRRQEGRHARSTRVSTRSPRRSRRWTGSALLRQELPSRSRLVQVHRFCFASVFAFLV